MYHDSSMPQWLPNNQKLIYLYHEIGEPYYIYTMNKDGSDNRKLISGRAKVYFYPDSYNFIYENLQFNDSSEFIIYKSNLASQISIPVLNLRKLMNPMIMNVGLYDFNPLKNNLLLLLPDSLSRTTILAEYNLDTGKVDTLAVEDGDWLFERPQYSTDYSKILLVEYNSLNKIQKLSLLEKDKKSEFVSIEGLYEGFAPYPCCFSSDDRYLAYSKSVIIPGEYFNVIQYLYVIDLNTGQITYIDQGIIPQFGQIKLP